MRHFFVLMLFFLPVFLVGCSGMSNPFQSTPTATSSRISSDGGSATSSGEVVEEGTIIFNSHLDISAGDLVNPIPSLLDDQESADAASTSVENVSTYDGDIWPDEVRNSDDAPLPDAIEDGGGGVEPDEVVDSSNDDSLVAEVIDDDVASGGGQSEPNDSDDDGDIWGEVVD